MFAQKPMAYDPPHDEHLDKKYREIFWLSSWVLFSSDRVDWHCFPFWEWKFNVRRARTMRSNIWSFLAFRWLQEMLHTQFEYKAGILTRQRWAVATFPYFQCLQTRERVCYDTSKKMINQQNLPQKSIIPIKISVLPHLQFNIVGLDWKLYI